MTWKRVPHQPITYKPWSVRPASARVTVCVVSDIEHYNYRPLTWSVGGAWLRKPHLDCLDCGLWSVGNWVGPRWIAVVIDAVEVPLSLLFNLANWICYINFFEAFDEYWPGFITKKSGWFRLMCLHLWLFRLPHSIEYLCELIAQIFQAEGLWVNQIGKISTQSRSMQCVEVMV